MDWKWDYADDSELISMQMMKQKFHIGLLISVDNPLKQFMLTEAYVWL